MVIGLSTKKNSSLSETLQVLKLYSTINTYSRANTNSSSMLRLIWMILWWQMEPMLITQVTKPRLINVKFALNQEMFPTLVLTCSWHSLTCKIYTSTCHHMISEMFTRNYLDPSRRTFMPTYFCTKSSPCELKQIILHILVLLNFSKFPINRKLYCFPKEMR